MKKTRRIAAFIAAMAMAACVAVPFGSAMTASAANSITITNTDKATHTYKAYKIFSGTLSTDGTTLTGIDWGDGVNGANLLSALNTASTAAGNPLYGLFPAATVKTAADVANVLGTKNFIDDGELTQAFAAIVGKNLIAENGSDAFENSTTTDTNDTSKITGLGDGYYLIQDESNPTGGVDNTGARSRYMIKVAGEDVKIKAKHSAPSVMKKVQENSIASTDQTTSFAGNDSYSLGNGYNDIADYNIGDSVPFKLYGTMPSTLGDYSAYYYEFSDTLASQFDQPTSVKVTVENTELTFTLNTTAGADNYGKYEVDSSHRLAAVTEAVAEQTTTVYYLNGDDKFKQQVDSAFANVEGWGTKTEAQKAEYLNTDTNWNTFIGTDIGKGYTAEDKAIYIKSKTVVTSPAIKTHDADATTDGNCRVAWDSTNHKLNVTFENIKAYTGVDTDTVVTVEYSATLNNTAVIGLDGQENKVKLVYSSNPNVNYTPDTNDTDDEGAGHKSGGNTNETPEDKVIVFTYELDVNKVDAAAQSLAGAQFVVYRYQNDGTTKEYAKVASNGTAYRLSEWVTTAPVKQTPADTATGFTDDEIATASTNGVFISTGNASKPIIIAGLDDGDYYLSEIATPDSTYNEIADIRLTVASTHKGVAADTATAGAVQNWGGTASDALVSLTLSNNADTNSNVTTGVANDSDKQDLTNGKVAADVINTKGSTLPSTGGIGTTLFYLAGGVMVIGAGVVLVTKKRMGKED